MARLRDYQVRAIKAGVSEKDITRALRRSSHSRAAASKQVKSSKIKQNPNIQRIYAKGRRIFGNKKLTGPRRIPGVKINGKPAIAIPRNDGKFNVIGAYAKSRDGKNYGIGIFNESGTIFKMSGRRTPRLQRVYAMIKNGGRSFRKGSTGRSSG